MMSALLLIVCTTGFGALGYWRGGLRLALALAPLGIASLVLWMLLEPLYRVDVVRHLGLAWPPVILLVIGLAGGYTLQIVTRKRIPKEPGRVDRFAGTALGSVVGVLVTFMGLITIAVRSNAQGLEAMGTGMARVLNIGVVQWIPGVGTGSNALMDLVELASAPEEARTRAAKELGLDHLQEAASVVNVANDPATVADLEAAARGNPAALWRLSRNRLIMALFEDPQIQEAMERVDLRAISEAVRRARQEPTDR